jgi:hypothetical protein
MKTTKAKVFWLVVVVAIVILASHPLNQSTSRIHRWLRLKTPIDSSLATVKATIAEEKWTIVREWNEQEPGKPARHIVLVSLGAGSRSPEEVRVQFQFEDDLLRWFDVYKVESGK